MNNANIVIDMGSSTTRAGFSNTENPVATFPTLIGKPRPNNLNLNPNPNTPPFYVGDEALARKHSLQLTHPIERGIVRDWDAASKILRHCLCHELDSDPSERNVMLTEPLRNSSQNSEKLCQTMFEELNVRGLYVQDPAVLSLYASGRTDGLVLSVGGGLTCAVPISEGYFLPRAVNSTNFGGRDLDEWLRTRF